MFDNESARRLARITALDDGPHPEPDPMPNTHDCTACSDTGWLPTLDVDGVTVPGGLCTHGAPGLVLSLNEAIAYTVGEHRAWASDLRGPADWLARRGSPLGAPVRISPHVLSLAEWLATNLAEVSRSALLVLLPLIAYSDPVRPDDAARTNAVRSASTAGWLLRSWLPRWLDLVPPVYMSDSYVVEYGGEGTDPRTGMQRSPAEQLRTLGPSSIAEFAQSASGANHPQWITEPPADAAPRLMAAHTDVLQRYQALAARTASTWRLLDALEHDESGGNPNAHPAAAAWPAAAVARAVAGAVEVAAMKAVHLTQPFTGASLPPMGLAELTVVTDAARLAVRCALLPGAMSAARTWLRSTDATFIAANAGAGAIAQHQRLMLEHVTRWSALLLADTMAAQRVDALALLAGMVEITPELVMPADLAARGIERVGGGTAHGQGCGAFDTAPLCTSCAPTGACKITAAGHGPCRTVDSQ